MSYPPQHSTAPSARTPQEWNPPADIELSEPSGASLRPKWSRPQHSAAPPARSPHEYLKPADTETECDQIVEDVVDGALGHMAVGGHLRHIRRALDTGDDAAAECVKGPDATTMPHLADR